MILQGPGRPGRVRAELAALIADPAVERLRIAVAYANLGGVRILEKLLDAAGDGVRVEIIVTLDMGITRKAALEALLRDFTGEARIVTTASGLGTFHAKVFVVDRAGGATRAMVGSANLTDAALVRNYEAVTVADLGPTAATEWEAWWAELGAASSELTEEVIANYTERRPPPGRREHIADEDVETNSDDSTVTHARPEVESQVADWLVIDWGGTGGYRVQLELPKLPAAFFGVERDHERPLTLRYDGRDYENNQLTFYPQNGMPRINMDPELPGVADKSIKTATVLFSRVGADRYEVQVLNPEERARRLAEAQLRGEAEHTTRKDGSLREFGWV